MQEVRIDHLHLLREERFWRQRERFGGERRVAVRKNAPACVEECPRRRAFPAEDDRGGEPLTRLPAIEGIVVASHQVHQLLVGERIVEDHRGGEASQVTAWPSCRLKYRRIPAWNFSSPSRLCCMRTSSAPFSYTVMV